MNEPGPHVFLPLLFHLPIFFLVQCKLVSELVCWSSCLPPSDNWNHGFQFKFVRKLGFHQAIVQVLPWFSMNREVREGMRECKDKGINRKLTWVTPNLGVVWWLFIWPTIHFCSFLAHNYCFYLELTQLVLFSYKETFLTALWIFIQVSYCIIVTV